MTVSLRDALRRVLQSRGCDRCELLTSHRPLLRLQHLIVLHLEGLIALVLSASMAERILHGVIEI